MRNHYALWKNLLLLFILIVAFIYALPNIFGNDPAVQISASDTQNIQDELGVKIKKFLTDKQLSYLALEQHVDSVLLRFSDADIQMKVRDMIKAELGDNYIVALNLAPRTPKWLQALGANPMKLGLDLCGGVHFLLAVDLHDMLQKREAGDLRAIISDLRELDIRYMAIERLQPHGIAIMFRDLENLDKGQVELAKRLKDYQFAKVIENGVFKLQAMMSEKVLRNAADYTIDQTVTILHNRVNELGISEAIVQRQGENHVSVDLPGIQDTVRAKEIIGKTATLKFHMVETEHDIAAALAGDVPLGTKLYDYEGRKILLKDRVILQGNAITYAAASFSQDGRPAVTVHLGGGGESTFHRVTAENIGQPMAIVYVETKTEQKIVEGKVVTTNRQIEKIISSATIQSALGNDFQITGLREQKYAENLALLLRSGALIAPVTIVEELTVGPSMGKFNINKGILSIAVGYVFVMLFMALYYRFFGIISNIALLFNLIFMVAILSILGATLTLPGMAGMVLTVGMAVDASVLIYERIREELRNGISPQASIYTGYQRAFTTIVDANAATLIVAMVLFALGTGAIKGFAVVLTIGLMTSMLTSIVYTRAIVNLLYGKKQIKGLPIGI